MDFSRICRICLETHKQTYDIFTHIYLKGNCVISDMLARCTKLNPCLDDGLPRLICKQCSRQLKRTYSFNIKCEKSAEILLSYLQNKSYLNIDVDMITSSLKNEKAVEPNGVKHESDNEQGQNEDDQKYFDSLSNDDLKDEIKFESIVNEDSCWDSDDDNILLKIRHKNKTQGSIVINNSSYKVEDGNIELKISDTNNYQEPEEQPKKKRGRKKKVILEGETPQLPESKLPHQCDICGKFLSTKSNLKAHKVCHTDLRPFRCTDCPASFRGHSALFQHRKVHTGETPYHCEYCPKQFSRRTGLVNHIRMHTGEKLYSCDICFKTFVQSAQLSIHMKRHKGDKPFLCQDCGKGFPIKADLKVHQRIHNGEKPYSCHLCNKTFATSGNLNIHVRIHNREIRYNCKECQRGFVTCSAYNVHLKRHKGQRDYHCECGKTFYTSSALKQHKVVHTGEKKYQCKICDRKFTQTSHLSRHFKRDHAKPNAPVPSSDHYKLVLQDEGYKQIFNANDSQKTQSREDTLVVKCEGS